MMCRACEQSANEQSAKEEQPTKTESRRRTGDAGSPRAKKRGGSEQLCSRCGDLLGREEIEQRARKKASQLAKFGLDRSGKPLLKKDQAN